MKELPVKKTVTQLADGRELIYYDAGDAETRGAFADQRPLEPVDTTSETRFDPVQGEWVAVAAHRQGRPYLPPTNSCPLCPSTPEWHSEIPAPEYDVVVFENRFPSFSHRVGPAQGDLLPGLVPTRPGAGRCEVVCFTSDHTASFASLAETRVRTVRDAWSGRTAELAARADVELVFPFENRGEEIGVTMSHPHGLIYASPFVPPRTRRMLASARSF